MSLTPEPRAWLYEHEKTAQRVLEPIRYADLYSPMLGWTEIPLYGPEALAERDGLRPMIEAPRDRTPVLVKVRDDVNTHYAGRWFVAFYEGVTDDDYDLGWGLYPGYGGVLDRNFEGWMPLPKKGRTDD